MGRIIYFETTSESVDTTAQFYAEAFGWRSRSSPHLPGYRLLDTGAGTGIDGAVMSREHSAQPVIVWLEVDDLRAVVADVEAAGGARRGEINEIPGEGLVCYVTDPAGVVFGLKQPIG
ncbi:VOC family protein [Microbacterium sp.]|uniref:VOC family protein n=1 Tax=Microbacterium sp. TaxID=51671 RepID=UPI00281226AB|nr:VOC family protein [Microbacterium sp.]